MKGNVTFISNLYPVKDNITEDIEFIQKIRDPFCLEKMVKNPAFMNKLSSEQCIIFSQAGVHCDYAEKGDFPWGSVILENGIEKTVCKCTNEKCFSYETCRSDLFEE